MENSGREWAVHVAKLAEQTGRYDDMAKAMKAVVKLGAGLNKDEADLLSIGYEQKVESRRASWKILAKILVKEHSLGWDNVSRTIDYMVMLRDEIVDICNDVISLMDENITATGPEDRISLPNIFYLQMKGDFSWYLAEYESGYTKREAAITQSMNAYKDATAIVRAHLRAGNPIRLSLALDYANLHFDIYQSIPGATKIAKQAYNEAYPHFSTMNEDSKKLMQDLRDKIMQWDPAANVPPPPAAAA